MGTLLDFRTGRPIQVPVAHLEPAPVYTALTDLELVLAYTDTLDGEQDLLKAPSVNASRLAIQKEMSKRSLKIPPLALQGYASK